MLRKLLRTVPSLVVFACVILSSASAWAQASIVGLVKDESGAVLPGVTVEAASPALIEGVKAVDRRPGTLSHRSAAARHVQADVFAVRLQHVHAHRRRRAVGHRRHRQRRHEGRRARRNDYGSGNRRRSTCMQASRTQVITRDIIDALPVSRNVMSIGVLAAGVRPGTPDIGGSRMTEQVALRAHGLCGNDAEQLVEGMSIQSLEGPRSPTSTTCCSRKSPS